jgi:SAM-dependent methyltransferase
MEQLRKTHNLAKRELINKWVPQGSRVLDCGCGRGGDLAKWRAMKVNLFMVDPDEESLQEAQNRAHEMNFGVWFLGCGDIRDVVDSGPWDVVCYNFSLQYIFETDHIFDFSIKAIAKSVQVGGRLIGILPDEKRIREILKNSSKFTDELGNTIELRDGKLWVYLTDGPFYAAGARPEPLIDVQKLINSLADHGFQMAMWLPMLDRPNGLISDIYSKFVFTKIR